jgi:hypothetical protein
MLQQNVSGTGIQRREIEGYGVIIDGKKATISANVPEEVQHKGYSNDTKNLIYTNPAELLRQGATPSFSLIRFAKVKNFIDGVYAAVEERVAERGHSFSRPDFLRGLEKVVRGDAKEYVRAILRGTTLGDPSLEIPQGFYDWEETLKDAYREIKLTGKRPGFFQNREDDEKFNQEIMRGLNQAITQNPKIKKIYDSLLKLYSKTTDRLKDTPTLFPACELPDQEFFVELSRRTQSDIPGGLGKALVNAIKAGEVRFDIRDDSGLYSRQMNEVVPLVLRDTAEFRRFLVNDKYAEILEKEFISQWAGTRHTHVGHADFGTYMIGCSVDERRFQEPLEISPELQAEPFSTSYQRMAENLKFLEGVLKGMIPEVLNRSRLMPDGSRSEKQIGEEFGEMMLLLEGLSEISRDSIHEPYKRNKRTEEAKKTTYQWLDNASKDPDINRNTSIIVPIIRTTDGARQVCYINAGFSLLDVNVEYHDKPKVTVSPDRGHVFREALYSFPVLVHREVRIPYKTLLNDRKLRSMLDETFYEAELDALVEKLEKN